MGTARAPRNPEWRALDREKQLTTEPADIDPALAKLLTDNVAPEQVIFRVFSPWGRVLYPGDGEQRPLIKLLGCRLQVQLGAKLVMLPPDMIERLREATGPCGQPSQ